MSRASWLSGEATRPRRPTSAPVTVVPEPELPPVVAEPVMVQPVPRPAPSADLPSRLAQALALLEDAAPVKPYAGTGTHRRHNQVVHALDTARNALRRAQELAR